jgi:hypothetical protein
MISSILDPVISFLDNPIVMAILCICTGWIFRKWYVSFTSSSSIGKSKVELVNMMIAHQIVARAAIAFLNETEKEALEDTVKNELDESFIDDIGFDVK